MNDMPPETLAAIKESISHWERLASGERLEGENHCGESCALCRAFIMKNKTCDGCPIAAAGFPFCEGSPYEKAEAAYCKGGRNYDSDEFKYAAQDMLDFLKGLLPK